MNVMTARAVLHAIVLLAIGTASSLFGQSLPTAFVPPSSMCSGVSYINETGDTVTGTRTCGSGSESTPSCSIDGQINCTTTAAFKAASSAQLTAANIKLGATIGGITGGAGYSDCSSDGQTGCLATDSFKSAHSSVLIPAHIKLGVTIGAVAGSIVIPSSCTSNGTDTCLVAGPYYSAPLCSTAGSNCYVAPWDNSTHFLRATNYTNITNNTAKIRTNTTIANVTGTLADCGTDGQTTCVTTSMFRAANLSNITPSVVRSGVVINSVTGDYPSSTYPLPSASSTPDLDAATFNAKIKASGTFEYWDSEGNRYTGAGDTDISPENIVSGIDVFGTTGTFISSPPAAEELRGGVVVGGTTGSLRTSCRNYVNTASFSISMPGPPLGVTVNSATDQINLTGHTLAAGDRILISGSPQPGGTSPSSFFYVINPSTNSFQISTTSGGAVLDLTSVGANVAVRSVLADGVADSWDSIDDNGSSLVGAHIPDEQRCLEVAGTSPSVFIDATRDVSGNPSSCSSYSSRCTLRDKTTNLEWSKTIGATQTWSDAIATCDNLTHNTYSDWRLPTQKEFLELYVHGILSALAGNTYHINPQNYYWTSTTKSSTPANAFYIKPAMGLVWSGVKTVSQNVTCVRP